MVFVSCHMVSRVDSDGFRWILGVLQQRLKLFSILNSHHQALRSLPTLHPVLRERVRQLPRQVLPNMGHQTPGKFPGKARRIAPTSSSRVHASRAKTAFTCEARLDGAIVRCRALFRRARLFWIEVGAKRARWGVGALPPRVSPKLLQSCHVTLRAIWAISSCQDSQSKPSWLCPLL